MIKPLSLLLILLFCLNALAEDDIEIMHSMRCMSLFSSHELKYRLPSDTLHSISLQESGRMHSTGKIKMVWPWTVNVEGKGYHFDSKKEAVRFVKRSLAQGKKSIDVGCMQVNLKQHPDAFGSVEEALDPKSNVNYGAYFLRSKYEQLGSWSKAIAHYHSATPAFGVPYKENVIKIARNIEKYKSAFLKGRFASASSAYNTVKFKSKIKMRSGEESGNGRSGNDRRKHYRSNMMIYVPRG